MRTLYGSPRLLLKSLVWHLKKATTSAFFMIAILSAAARAFIRIFYLKRVNVDDYFFFLAVATLMVGEGISFSNIRTSYRIEAIRLFCWATIISVKFSFLFYFRGLVDRWYKMEIWWWFTFAVMVPTAAISIAATFTACLHKGSSIPGMLDLSPYRTPFSWKFRKLHSRARIVVLFSGDRHRDRCYA